MLSCKPFIEGDTDVPLDIQAAAARVYLRGLYWRIVDYTVPPDPPLPDDDAAWADALLRAAGLRQARETRNHLDA